MNETTAPETRSTRFALPRRHEIDALRSIALLLLIFYHVFVALQPSAAFLKFIGPPNSLQGAWFIGEALNPWRIPVLFLIAGITAGYLLQNRKVGSLLKSRLLRLVPPLLFTALFIAPISPALYQSFKGDNPGYMPNPGHLWFVWNLTVYFVFGAPALLYLKNRRDNLVVRILRSLSPYGWLLALPTFLTLTTYVLEPHVSAEMFGVHFSRFWNGFACFLAGAALVSLGDCFWRGISRVCHAALPAALILYLLRMKGVDFEGRLSTVALRTMESAYGMLAFLGYGSIIFSKPSRLFTVLNRSVFAVYIIHLPVQQAVAYFLVRLDMNAWLTLALHLVATLTVSALIYALVLRPLRWLHPFFGIAPLKSAPSGGAAAKTPPPLPPWPVKAGRFATLYIASPILVLAMAATLIFSALTMSRDLKPGQLVERSSAETATTSASFKLLIEAAGSGDLEAIQSSIAAGVDVNQPKSKDGGTALHAAATFGCVDAIKLLLEHGADIDQRNNDGSTPLFIAAFYCQEEAVKTLLKAGADKNARDNKGTAPRDVVQVPWNVVEPIYKFLDKAFASEGLPRLDLDQIKRDRPRISELLQ